MRRREEVGWERIGEEISNDSRFSESSIDDPIGIVEGGDLTALGRVSI